MSNSSLGNWHRRATGHYVRKRGAIYDSVKRISRGRKQVWTVYVDGVGGNRLFKTRLEATAALDSWLRSPERNSVSEKRTEAKDAPKREENSTCDGCNGSGIYYGKGYVENGVFKGFSGKCFRCGGKGHQDESDRKRNWGFDNFHRRIEG